MSKSVHPRVLHVLRPAHEMRHGALRTVGVVDLQAVPALHAVVARRLEGGRGLFRDQRARPLVAVHALPDEVVRRVVADLQDGVRHRLGERHETVVRLDPHPHFHASRERKRQRDRDPDHSLSHSLFLSLLSLRFKIMNSAAEQTAPSVSQRMSFCASHSSPCEPRNAAPASPPSMAA